MAELMAQLRRARLAAGLTQADVAHRTGYSRRSILRWESGVQDPGLEALDAYATVVGVHLTIGAEGTTLAILGSALANLDAQIQRRATELAAARVREVEARADEKADVRIRQDRDYWKKLALDLKAKTRVVANA